MGDSVHRPHNHELIVLAAWEREIEWSNVTVLGSIFDENNRPNDARRAKEMRGK